MRKGEVINGYEITKDFSTKDAGLSKWTFARKNGSEYFIKEFLAPKYPLPDAPGSAEGKKRRLKECQAFERHHQWLMDLTQPVAAPGGNLIVTLDFFRVGAHYYKVTERIDAETLDPAKVSKLDVEDQLVILSATTHSLKILHRAGIVHGDLKPTNVMIKPTKRAYTAKLIDFDNAYVTGDPPPPERLVGTINYYAPELYLYLKGRLDPMDLTVQADIFALGIVFTEMLTGDPPGFDTAKFGRYAGAAVAEGANLEIPESRTADTLVRLLESMLSVSANDRPTVDEIHSQVRSAAKAAAHGDLRKPSVRHDSSSPDLPAGSRLRRSGPAPTPPADDVSVRPKAADAASSAKEEPVSRLKGSGLGGGEKR